MVFNLFKKNSFEKCLDFYENLNQKTKNLTDNWLALTVNVHTHHDTQLTKELVITSASTPLAPLYSVILADASDGLFQSLFLQNNPHYLKHQHSPEETTQIRSLFNYSLDQIIESEIVVFQKNLKLGEFSPIQKESEENALEWMKVSFDLLEKAVIQSLTNSEYMFQSTFFCGVNPETRLHEIRVIIFNLDITFWLLNDHNLRVKVFNKKNLETFDDLKPSLIGDYSFRKREMMDRFTKLLAVLSKGFHL